MDVELISREIIKPSLPTPSHLRIFPLSFIDNIISRIYVPTIFFYNPDDVVDQNSKISQLKKSLSQLLSKYYPFAGRLKDKITIECNDQGVPFFVTKIKNKLSEILQNPTENLLNPLFPDELQWTIMDWSENLILFQINCFACGGMAVSINVSHKSCDVTTFFNLMNDWATINRKVGGEEERSPILHVSSLLDGGASVFPQRDLPIFPEISLKSEKNIVCKRFVFQPSMIKFLKEEVSSSSMPSPSRVLVVSAWIYKSAVLNLKTTPFMMPVNLRNKMVPPLSNKCVGNIIWFLSIFADKKEMKLKDLVFKFKEGLSEFIEFYPKIFGGIRKDNLSLISKCLKQATDPLPENQNTFNLTSRCKLPLYEIDFGWGKPTWITATSSYMKNFIILMDTKDGSGVEAIVDLEENAMTKFEHNVKLLQNASLNLHNVGHKSNSKL